MQSSRMRATARLLVSALMILGCDGDPAGPVDDPMLRMSSGTGQTGRAGKELAEPLVVSVVRNGVPVAGAQVAWEVEGGELQAESVTDAEGMARAHWKMPGTEGSYRVLARLGPGDGPAVEFLGISRHPLIIVIEGDEQLVTVGEEFARPFKVRVTWNGSPLEGESIWWTRREQPTLTDAEGFSTAELSAGTRAGRESISARLGDEQGPFATFMYTAAAGPVASVVLDDNFPAGHWVEGSVHWARATVKDEYGNAVNGAPMAWLVTEGEASLTADEGATNNDGIAYVDVVFPTGYSGEIELAATAAGVTGTSRRLQHTDFLIWNPTGWGDEVDPGNTITVAVGAPVRWVHVGSEDHILAPDGGGAGHELPRGGVFEQQYGTAGTFGWTCEVHAWETFSINVTP